jgi:3-dehydroquinate dehydratase type I
VSLRICVSILPKTEKEALTLIGQAEAAKADLIEVRLDCLMETQNLQKLASATKLPLIATNKLKSEGGYYAGTEAERQQILFAAADGGFRYVDVDFSSPNCSQTVAKLKNLGAAPIVSYHKFDGVLPVSALERILDEQIAAGAAVCKIVLTAKQIEDNLPVLSFVSFAAAKAKLVCFCMGKDGKTSRLLSPMFGAFFTFASLDGGSETAAGQMSIADMRAAYGLLGVLP